MEDLSKILSYFDRIDAPYFCEFSYLKKCFRIKIKRYHPDRGASEDEAKEIISSFKELERLYKDERLLIYYKTLFENRKLSSDTESLEIVDRENNVSLFRNFYYGLKINISRKWFKFAGLLVVLVVVLFFVKDLVSFLLAILVILISVYLYNKVL